MTASRDRIEGLDIWRALLTGGGLFVHASIGLERVPLFDVVEGASQAFRMGTFFAISGLLTAIVLSRRGPWRWLLMRLMQLCVPAIVGVATLSPLVWWLFATAPIPTAAAPLPFEWHHLWFLYGLALYSVVAVGLDAADRRTGWAARLDGRVRSAREGRVLLLAVGLAGGAMIGAAPPVMRALMPAWALSPFANVQMIAGHLPMFVLGFALGRCPRLRARTVHAPRFALLLLVVAGGAFALSHAAGTDESARAMTRFVAAALCPPAAFALILRSALSVRRVPAAVRKVSDASFTIYVLHLPLAAAFNTRLGAGLDAHLAYLLCVPLAGLGSYWLHTMIVTRWAPLALVVNGRLPARAALAGSGHRGRRVSVPLRHRAARRGAPC